MRNALSLLLVLCLAACGGEPSPREATSAKGLYKLSWSPSPDPIPFAELFALDVTLTDASGAAVNDATLAFDVEMPAHGHGMQTSPTVEALSDGRYRIEGMKFHMRGTWTLVFEVNAAPGADSVTFEEAFY